MKKIWRQEESSSANRSPGPEPGRLPAAGMNAFELMTSALDISAMFERRTDVISRGTRFTSRAPPPDILQRLEDATASLGGHVKRRDASRSDLEPLQDTT